MDERSETCTIILTDQPPVRIRKDDWPMIAYGSFSDWDDPNEYRASRKWHAELNVRQHDDGRVLIYGVYRHSTVFPGERNFTAHAGVLVNKDANLVEAVRAVGAELMRRVAREDGRNFAAHIAAAVRECIADLPTRELE